MNRAGPDTAPSGPDPGLGVTILTQYFHPEVASTAQLLTDLALGLRDRGYRVRVFTGQPSYWKHGRLPGSEVYQGIAIRRFFTPGMSKQRVLGRLLNAASVASLMCLRLLFGRKPGVIMADSTSPFLPVVAWLLHMLRRWPYVFLVEDIYPDIAIRLGYMRPNGLAAKVWHRLNRWIYGSASRVIVLGPRMRDVALRKLPGDADPDKVVVIHNWADGDFIVPRPKKDNWFCQQHGLTDGLVVLYSGNMGLFHDLESVVEAAYRLQSVPDIRFVFIGDGGKREKIARMIQEKGLQNVLLLPYQPQEVLPYSLTCGDLSVVTLEPGVEGLGVPSKLYSSLAAGQAVLALVAEGSEVCDIIQEHQCGFRIGLGDVEGLAEAIIRLHRDPDLLQQMKLRARACFEAHFTRGRAIEAYAQTFDQVTRTRFRST